ncbi:MAG: hypothetical protein ACJ77M_10110 [Thermoleophilaceae bacterium]
MARGVVTSGATTEEAEAEIREKYPQFRVVRTTRMRLNDALQGSEFGKTTWWVTVIEDPDPENAPLPQQANPEAETEETFRQDLMMIVGQLQGNGP